MSFSLRSSRENGIVARRSNNSQIVPPENLMAYEEIERPQSRSTIASFHGGWGFAALETESPKHSARGLDQEDSAMSDTGSWVDQDVVSRATMCAPKRPRASPGIEPLPRKRQHSYSSPQARTTYKAEHNNRFIDNCHREDDSSYGAEDERDESSVGLGISFSRSGSRQSVQGETYFCSFANGSSQIRNSYPHGNRLQTRGSRNGPVDSHLGGPFGHEHSPHGGTLRNNFSAYRPHPYSPRAQMGRKVPFQQARSSHNTSHLGSPLYANSSPIWRQRDAQHQVKDSDHYVHDISPSRERRPFQALCTPRHQRARSPSRDIGFRMGLDLARSHRTSPKAHDKAYINCSDGQLQDTDGMVSLDAVGSPGLRFMVGRSQSVAPNTPQHQQLLNSGPYSSTALLQSPPGNEDQDIDDFDYGTTPLEQMLRKYPRKPRTEVKESPYDPRKVLPQQSMIFKERVHKLNRSSHLRTVDRASRKGSGVQALPIDLLSPDVPPPRGFRSTPMKERLPLSLKPAAPKKSKARRPPLLNSPTSKAKAPTITSQLTRQQQVAAVITSIETKAHDEELQRTIFGELVKPSREEEKLARSARREEAERQSKEKERLEEEAREAEDSARQLQQEQEAELRRAHDLRLEREKKANQAKIRAQRQRDKLHEEMKLEENRKRTIEKMEADRAKAEAERDAKALAKMHAHTVQAEPAMVAEIKFKQEMGKMQAASLKRSSLFPREKPEKVHISPYANDEPLFVTDHDKSLDIYDVDERAKGKLTGPSSAMEVMAAARSDRPTFQDARAEFERKRKEREDQLRRERCGERNRKIWEAKAAAAASSESSQSSGTPKPQKRATGGPSTRIPRQAPKTLANPKGSANGERTGSTDLPESLFPARLTEISSRAGTRSQDAVRAVPEPAGMNIFKPLKQFSREQEAEKRTQPQKRPLTHAQKDARRKNEEDKFRAKVYKQISDLSDQNGYDYTEEMKQAMIQMRVDERRSNLDRRDARKNRTPGANPSLPLAPSQATQSSKDTEENPEVAPASQSRPTSNTRQNAISGLKGPMIAAAAARQASYGKLPHNISVKDLQNSTSRAVLAANSRSYDNSDSEDSEESEEDPDDEEATAAYLAVYKNALPSQKVVEKEIERDLTDLSVEGEELMEGDKSADVGALNPDENSALRGNAKNMAVEPVVPQVKNDKSQADPQTTANNSNEQPRVYYVNQADTYDSEADLDKVVRLGEFHNREKANAFAAEKVKEYRGTAGEPRQVTVEPQKGFYFCELSHDDHRATVFWVVDSEEGEDEEDIEEQASDPNAPPPAESWDVYLELTDEKDGEKGEKRSILKGNYTDLAIANKEACKVLFAYVKPTVADAEDAEQHKDLGEQLELARDDCNKTKSAFSASLDIDEESISWMRGDGLRNVNVCVEEHKRR